MKTSIAITAFALAFAGAAYAQDGGAGPGKNYQGQAATSAGSHAKGDGIVAKTKRGMHRMGDKMRHAMHRDHRNDTSAMGASDSSEAARRSRMDEAYENYRAKQVK